jgi:hypothetical protein
MFLSQMRRFRVAIQWPSTKHTVFPTLGAAFRDLTWSLWQEHRHACF